MATEIVMPRQGQSVEACTIVRWLKQPGETVATGELLCEIETDKASFEVESTAAGTLLAQFAAEGDEVPVLSPIAAVGEPGEQAPAASRPDGAGLPATTPAQPPPGPGSGTHAAAPGAPAGPGATTEPFAVPAATAPALGAAGVNTAPAQPAPAAHAVASAASQPVPASATAPAESAPVAHVAAPAAASVGVGRASRRGLAASPRARRRAAELGVDYTSLAGSGPNGRIIERDVVAAAQARPALTGAARAAAAAGAPVPTAGTGIGGRVTLADLAAIAAAPVGTAAPAAEPVETVPITGVRKLISERMRQSLRDTAQLTMTASADAEALIAYRARLKASPEHLGLGGATINDLVLYAVARTLPQFPQLNAVVRSDGGGDRIERHRDVHLAFAVDTERGLVVPVINAAHQLSVAGLAARAHELTAATQAGSISPDLLQGGTFTVTNLGVLGIESFTPVLNLPQVAILGVGALALKPVATDLTQPGPLPEVSYRRHLGLSLTIDHRVVDGAPAARFLQALSAAIADIDLLAAL